MASTEATLRAFFQAPKYAVVGASTNTEKFGYKGTFRCRCWSVYRACGPTHDPIPLFHLSCAYSPSHL